jgi:hypothetical protein
VFEVASKITREQGGDDRLGEIAADQRAEHRLLVTCTALALAGQSFRAAAECDIAN